MELHDRVVLLLGFGDLADAQLVDASLARRMVVALQDHHVAAVASAAREVATAGGVVLDGSDHLDELVTHGDHRVLQTERLHPGVVEGDLDAEDALQVVDHGIEIVGDESELTQTEHVGHLPMKRGARFSTLAAKASRVSAVVNIRV